MNTTCTFSGGFGNKKKTQTRIKKNRLTDYLLLKTLRWAGRARALQSYIVVAFTSTQQTDTLHCDWNRCEDTQPPHRPDILNAAVLLKRQQQKSVCET